MQTIKANQQYGVKIMIQPKFKIGDKVTRKSFVDSSGLFVEAIENLTVTRVRLIEASPESHDKIKPYYRILAENGGTVEGAERFFVAC